MELPALAGTIFAVVVVGCYLLESFVFLSKDPREPEYSRPRVPLIGHILGLNKYGAGKYFTKIAAQIKGRIFAAPIFNFKFYVISDRKFIASIQRNAKTISFVPFAVKASQSLSGISEKSAKLQDHLEGGPEAKEFDRVQRATLAAGSDLDELSHVATQVKLDMIEKLLVDASKSSDSATRIDLFAWVKHAVTLSSTEGMFGPLNPYKNPDHEADFWTFSEKAHVLLGGGFIANLLAKDAVQARDRNSQRYEEYVNLGGLENASGLIKGRSRVMAENGVSQRDIARSNVGFDIAMLANYVPTSWWAIFEVFSRPWLVEEIRKEVSKAVKKHEDGNFTLNLSILKSSSPLLLSSIQEAQRLHMIHAHIREVLHDTIITVDDIPQLFKKGNYVQLNGIPILRSEETWGADATSFDAYRFIKMKRKADVPGVATPGDLPPHSFPVWGVAPHICPARWFATGGAMALIALMALKLDMEVEPGFKGEGPAGREWRMPKVAGVFAALQSPGEPIPVVVRPRKEFEGKCNIETGTSGTRLQLSVG
ncbi:7-alpha-hydroxycholest-4-en-3-one 12-alpha-hydroxylase [Colletotrichum spaethianum]|uniref:7-alpha-hydroxycholest-4-en-3-one 12-alpha-hydroxylase n=1 Tax=Colletotrichum spaethianum TaxID=700344 RepID=A0AA37P6Z0_9PEZI|nr:7-alpha-hydroxycholest-4-en-3-one 12-alpha-hydroxylase [Colletotrichum spaethianum]GKT41164.1 7-alpha-hydroxycholest-4-en-3-one 12-alpha-hydroxylase [Colletotrichum spaethianum]